MDQIKSTLNSGWSNFNWSLAAILYDEMKFLSVPLELCGGASRIAQGDGVRTGKMADYDDSDRFPNIASIHFTRDAGNIRQFAVRQKAAAAD